MVHKLTDDRFGLQILAVIVIALSAHRAVEAFNDTVGFGMPRLGLDVDQVVRLDDCRDIAFDELAAMIMHDTRLGICISLERNLQFDRHRPTIEAHQ